MAHAHGIHVRVLHRLKVEYEEVTQANQEMKYISKEIVSSESIKEAEIQVDLSVKRMQEMQDKATTNHNILQEVGNGINHLCSLIGLEELKADNTVSLVKKLHSIEAAVEQLLKSTHKEPETKLTKGLSMRRMSSPKSPLATPPSNSYTIDTTITQTIMPVKISYKIHCERPISRTRRENERGGEETEGVEVSGDSNKKYINSSAANEKEGE